LDSSGGCVEGGGGIVASTALFWFRANWPGSYPASFSCLPARAEGGGGIVGGATGHSPWANWPRGYSIASSCLTARIEGGGIVGGAIFAGLR